MQIKASLPIRLLTHNIRYATTSPFKHEELWPVRLPLLLAELQHETRHQPASIICLQEVLYSQLTDILSGLNAQARNDTSTPSTPEWTYIGVGRDDGHSAGEYSPILFRSRTLKLLSYKTTWLSLTPTVPSKSWDAASIRILTTAVLQHRDSGHTFTVLNTHLDDQGAESRRQAARMISRAIDQQLEESQGSRVLLAGDLNSETDGDAYRILSAKVSGVSDVREAVSRERRYGCEITYTGFGDEQEDPPARLDFIFVSEVGWSIEGYAVLENRFEHGVIVSDHRAVVADVVLLAA